MSTSNPIDGGKCDIQMHDSVDDIPKWRIPLKNVNAEHVKILDKTFTYHKPKNDQPKRYETIREYGKFLATQIIENSPNSRERSLALTNVEQAVMWANAAIARNE